MARGTRPYISAKEREIIKTNAKQAAQDPKIKYRSKIERALEEKENREKRQELRTINGRQVGLSTADSMEQATRSRQDYMKWAKQEYGDLTVPQYRQVRSIGDMLVQARQAREEEAARQQAIKDARARRLDPNNWKTTYAVEPDQRRPGEPKKSKKQFLDEQVQAKRNWESYLQGIGYKGYEGFNRFVKENGGTPTVDLWKKWNQMNVQNGKEGGMDYEYDPRYVSDEGLDSWQARQQGKANQAYNSAEKIAQDFEQSRPANAWGSVLDLLDEQEGLKANRPADYNKYREEYDEALYDSLNGKGAYEQRIDALQTDDDVLVLESELDALWDKMTPAEISRFDEGEAQRLNNEANQRRQDSTAQADDFFRYEYDPEYWGMEATPEEQRAALFDRIMGEGDSYEARTSTMTPEEKAELDRRLDAVLQSANETRNDTWDVHAADVATDMKTGDAYNSLVKQGEQEKEYRETIKDYGAKAAELQAQGYTGEYNAELVPRNEWVTDEEDTEGMVRHIDERSEIDKAYDIINGHGDANLNKNAIGMASKYDFLSDSPENNQKEQFNIFYAYDKENGTHLAEQYLAGLDAYLTNSLSEWQDFQARSIGEEPVRGPILRVASYPAKVATGLIGAAGTVAALLGDKSAQDPTSDWYVLDKFQNTLRDQQNEDIDKALGGNGTGKFLLGVVDSIADNIFAMGTGKALSPDNLDKSMRLVQAIMSGSATSSKMVEMLNNGRSATEAALYAIGDGAIEWITEKYSLENLLRPDIKQMLGNKKQMAAFIAKNIAAEGSEEMASDLLNLALDDILSTVFGHESEMLEQYNQLVASGMGDKEASRKVLMDKIHDVGMSGLAGALSGGFMSGGRMAMNAVTQRNIGANVKQSRNMNELLDVALKMDQGTQSRSMAEELVEKKHAGNKPTNVQLGKLSQLMVEESKESGSQGRATVTKVANLMEGRTAEGLDKRAVGQHLATEDDIRRAEGNRTGGAGEVIVGGRFAQVTGMERVTGEDGKSSWKIRVEENGKTSYVNPNEVKATNFATAAVLRQRAVNPEFYGGNYTNTLLKQVADGIVENIGQHLQDGYKIRWAAYLGQQMPQTGMNQQAAEELYLQSRQDAAQEWQEAQKDRQANFRGQGKGVVRLNGMEYGSDGFNAAVQQLDQQQRDRIELVANIAQASGFELDFYDANDADYKANVHGWENSKGITINLDSYDSRQAQAEGRKHHIVATLSHEMTHWLQRNNPKGYLQLQDFVLQKMADEGVNLAARAQDLMAQRGIGMTEAIDEIVANACDQVLGNQALADELKQNNKGLYNSIKNFVKNIVDKIKSAVFGMEQSASLDARRIMYKYGNELSKIWLGAYDEVLSGKIAEMEAQTAQQDIKKMSQAELDEEYMDAVKSGDMETAQRMVDEAAKRAGYTTPVLHHGTRAFGFTEFNVNGSGGMIFTTTDRRMGETYSGETQRTRITDKANIDALSLKGNELLKEAQKHWKKYSEYRLANKEDTERAKADAREMLQAAAAEIKQFIDDNSERFNELKRKKAKDIAACIENASNAKTDEELYKAWDKYDSETWFLKWEDEDLLFDMLTDERSKSIYMGKSKLSDFMYDGDLYIADRYGNERVFDNQLALELDAENHKGVYELYGNPGKQLVMDANGSNWNNLVPPEELNLYGIQRTRDIANAAYANYYDSVLIKNVRDSGGETAYNAPADVYIFFDGNQLKSADPVTYDDKGKVIPLSERFNFNKEDIRYSEAEEETKGTKKESLPGLADRQSPAPTSETKPGSSASENIITERDKYVKRKEKAERKKEALDREYLKAIEEGNETKQLQMIIDKYKKIKGIYPFFAPEMYSGTENIRITKAIKEGDAEAITKAAAKMAKYVPVKAVLIPMPGHTGIVTENTDTMLLAKELSRITGAQVINALEGNERESRFKSSNRNKITAEAMGLRQIKELPAGYFPLIIDNVVSKGETAKAAIDAIPGSAVLSYTKGMTDKVIKGLKAAFPTKDNQDNWIPISKKGDINNPHWRYSMSDDSSLEVAAWMEHVSPWSLQTEGERQLLSDYRGKRVALQLSIKRQDEYEKQIRTLEQKGELAPAERQKLAELRNKLDVQQGKQVRLLNELYMITGSEGYAGMMYRNQKLLDDYVQGRTIEQVEASVDQMVQAAQEAEAEIAKREKELKQMAENSAVQTIRRTLNSRGLKRTVDALRGQYRTEMSAGELEGRLAEIVLMESNGEDVTQAVQDLARDVAEKVTGSGSEAANEALQGMRGLTVQIGPMEQAQMKAQNISLEDIRQNTKGSGVVFKFVDDDKQSTMMQDYDEVKDKVPGLADQLSGSNTDVIALQDYIKDQLDNRYGGAAEFGIDTDELALFIKTSADMMLNNEMGGMDAKELQSKIAKQAGKIGQALSAVQGAQKNTSLLQQIGRKVLTNANALHGDIAAALDYYNTVAKQAAEVERNNVRKNVIEVLRNEHTKALVEQQQKYMDMMKNDRKAREIHQDNEVLRSKVDTELKRFRTLLTAETDKKNIQEEAKPLARQIAGMLADHDRSGMRKVTYMAREKLDDFAYRLSKMQGTDGRFDPDTDLDWLVIKAPNAEDNDTSLKERAESDLADIEKGLMEYQLAERQGPDDKRTGAEILQARKDALLKIQAAVEELSEMIRARSEAFIRGQKYNVMDLAEQMQKDMEGSRFKGERTGKLGVAADAVGNYIGYGNETPVYFIKNLKNRTMSLLAGGAYSAENESGLQALAAQKAIDRIVQDTGYEKWDGQEKHQVKVSGGRTIEMTTEQIMALYATWVRESNALRPEDTAHLLHGGFVLNKGDTRKGLYGREKAAARPIRMTQELLDGLESYLTAEQKDYVDRIVAYMSGELAEIGNRASLQTFGIRKFTEQYYFPIKSWGGVLNKSSASGVSNKNDNAAMRQSFTKRVMANAQNAIEIGDFTATAMKHIVGMIRFNTVGPAVENLNKVLNQQLEFGTKEYGEDGAVIDDDTYKRNIRALFGEQYGQNALKYLERWMEDINGGVTQARDDSIYGRLLSVFRKGAVAGSLSVAAQQPLSYIRAAMMVNPKYLAAATAPWNWGKVHAEMLKYSGVAVIKEMGKFDMNQGRSMIDFISPEAKQSRAKAAAAKVTDWSTKAPEIMDQVTWGRMWVACKLETAAKNPGMDRTSDAFMEKVAERFNDLMRKTQVYDSVMVRSQNMRSQNVANKMMTSFMAEPTLTLNVLADAVKNAGEKGGKLRLAKAAAIFILSAAAQAAVKGIMVAGRSPDEKKTLEEQFEIKWIQNFLSEANPMNLVPGLSEIVEALKQGDVSNDAMSVLGKLKTINEALGSWTTGKTPFGHRTLEDTIGQVMQIFTGVPLKNIMRDGRAMYNFFAPGKYAKRDSSGVVIKYGVVDSVLSGNNIAGLMNELLNKNGIGYGTSTANYTERMYNADKEGNAQRQKELHEYLTLGKGVKEDTINSNLKKLTKADDDMTASEKIKALREKLGMADKDIASWITKEYKEGRLDKEKAAELYIEANPAKTTDDAYFHFEQAEWEAETGINVTDSDFFRLDAALNADNAKDFTSAVKELQAHGYKEDKILEHVNKNIMKQYKEGKASRKQTEAALKKYGKVAEADIWWKIDRVDYQKQTGAESVSGYYYRLTDAINANKAEQITKAVQDLLGHGLTKEKIKGKLSDWKSAYLAADAGGRIKIKDALQKAYKAAGYKATDADKTIENWIKDSKKKKKK